MWFFEWLAGWLLNWLLSRLTKRAVETAEQVKLDHERGEINDANVKAYEEANERADRIRAAGRLLNRLPKP